MNVRLQKFIASSGLASRREADVWVANGHVTVNGVTATPGQRVDPRVDVVAVNGKTITEPKQQEYVIMHKPEGFVCTKARFKGERSVYELLPRKTHLSIAGRLDKDTSGLLIFTNDGDLLQRITHPSFQHEKEYIVTTARSLTREEVERLKRGVQLDEGRAGCDRIRHISAMQYQVVIHQGWKRQLRRMFQTIHVPVRELTRVRIGNVRLGNLQKGKTRSIKRADIV